MSASFDQTVKLLDYKTGKTIHTGKTSDGRKSKHYHHLELNSKHRTSLFRLLHLDKDDLQKALRKNHMTKFFEVSQPSDREEEEGDSIKMLHNVQSDCFELPLYIQNLRRLEPEQKSIQI